MAGPWEEYAQQPTAKKPWEEYAPAAPAPKGLFQQEGKGGLADYLPTGVTNALQRFSDTTTSSQDVATRGFGDKIFGTQDETTNARQRIAEAGGNTVPGDIATAVATAAAIGCASTAG